MTIDQEKLVPNYRFVRIMMNRGHKLSRERRGQLWEHIYPDSVYVAGIGNHWYRKENEVSCWEKVINMVKFTNDQGILCNFDEIEDLCLEWGDGFGPMRMTAVNKALTEGYDWVCFVDNDVAPEPHTLVKLIANWLPIISPYLVDRITDKDNERYLHFPFYKKDTGIHPVRWFTTSFMLFRTGVFRCTGPHFWSESRGGIEGIHFQHLWYYGHTGYVDTSIEVPVYKPPTYPFNTKMMTPDERRAYWERKQEEFRGPPDRRPADPDNPNILPSGEYWPFPMEENVDKKDGTEQQASD